MGRTQLATLAIVAMVGWAQAVPPPAQSPGGDVDPREAEQHGVARISVMQGEVSVRHGDAGELSAAALNAPLMATDRVATGANSRAEVQFDGINMIRLASSSEVRIGDLQYKHYLVQVAQGLTDFRVVRGSDAQVEISTPSVSMRPLGQGTYRVAVNPDGSSEITVRGGEAEVFSPKGSERLRAGQTMVARGDPSDPEFQINGAIPTDDFDRWNSQRDNELGRYTTSSRYTNPDIYGTEQLDQSGRWANDPQYGEVWVPNVDPDWAPYRDGRWVYEDYYGWTWLSADPWGWAPYHWGRWYSGPFGWAWWPGAFGPRAYWSPALVGFFGWGGGFGVGVGFGFGFGHVGWVPLAPFETFRPWYGRGITNVNIVNNVNVVNNFRNARFVNGRNGVTSMQAGQFGRGAVNSNNFVRATQADLRGAGSIQGRMPVTPAAASMRLSDRAVNTAGMPTANSNQRFAGRSNFAASNGPTGGATPSASPRSFNGVVSNNGSPNAGGSNTGANNGWTRMAPRGSTPTGGQGSVTGAGSGQSSNAPVAGNRGGGVANGGFASGNSGWRSFNPGGNPAAGNQGPAGNTPANTPANRGGFSGGNEVAPRGGNANPQTAPSVANGGGYRGGAPNGGYSAPPSRGFTPQQQQQQQQPIRISPPIVSNRGASGGGAARPDVHSGFGGAHPGGGGGGGHRGR
jgi:hypothetical protein